MTHPVGKALWFIETRLGNELSLADIACCAGVSRYVLLRAFGVATGHSVMRYVRGRRLTEAARRLAAGAPDILTVALDAGYGSHEAFTRAFRDQFGVTPDYVRAQRHLANVTLVEPIAMNDSLIVELDPPRFEDGLTLLIAGLGERYSFETNQGIPQQWERFQHYIGNIPGQIARTAYGICCNGDGAGNFEYIAGVEVASFDDLPAEFSRVRLPARRYAVFTHRDHISRMRATVYTIWNRWLPNSGYTHADAPDFELYDERFDPRTGTGAVEVWLPIEA
ncbi:MAG TPA: AraC family transcriptional regulator [Acetobacteraceae bacterium]|nr:AraC family transcriptional regulator [Acetobacteraceae bacterium]